MPLYLYLNLGTLLFPLLLSFDRKVKFYRTWGALLPAIFFGGLIFLIWDVYFTYAGIWSFNSAYLMGFYFLGLPWEEWLFFLTVPYACVFIYACLKAYFPGFQFRFWPSLLSHGIFWLCIGLGIVFWDRTYTATTAWLLAAWAALNIWVIQPRYLAHYFLAYGVSLIPFLLVNGILTAWPIVIYNNLENVSLRIGTIPVEDTLYLMLLLWMIINVYEAILSRNHQS